jgi:hypothetical protein
MNDELSVVKLDHLLLTKPLGAQPFSGRSAPKHSQILRPTSRS